MHVTKLQRARASRTKRAFTTRRVPARDMETLISGNVEPVAGNLVLATVHELGKHRKVERLNGRRALMMPGDEIIVCYGNRYAPDQFEALVCDDLSLCDLVAGGGIAAREINRHERMLPPTQIMPVGLIGNAQGESLNVADYRIPYRESRYSIKVFLSVGTAMNSGKTFTAASVVRGLKGHGYRVAGIKATGTGSGGDLWQMKDMGADVVLDFTDAGFASTYKAPDEAIEAGVIGLISHAAERKCTYAIMEIADGLQHQETATLLRSKKLQSMVSGVVFAAYDSMGAKSGYDMLRALGYSVLALSGQITRSPLAAREAARATGCTIYSPFEIQAGALVPVMTDLSDRDSLAAQQEQVRRITANAKNFVIDIERPEHITVRDQPPEGVYSLDYPEALQERA